MTAIVPLAPNLSAGPTGLNPYYPWSVVYLGGLVFVANGIDANRRWDGAGNFRLMGSVAPTDFGALSLTGAPGTAIPTGRTPNYYLVGYNSTADIETAPQGAAYISIANASGITKDVVVTWTPGSLAGDYTFRRIYRALDGTDDLHLVATVADSAGTYTDTSPDATIRTAIAYVPTYRTTLPPVFTHLGVVRSQMWGMIDGSARAYYAQPVNLGYTFVGSDFKSDQFVTIGAGDGRGDNVMVRERYGSAIWYKQRARYEMTGVDAGTWDFRKLNGDRGLIAERCIVDVNGRSLCLDERGIYWDDPAADPRQFGARPGIESPFQPLWDRMNLGAARWFFAIHDPVERLAYFFVALDFEPVPNVAVVVDYAAERFVGVDTLVWGTAGGTLFDAMGRVHLVFGCDMGYFWEPNYTAAQGVTAGTTSSAVTASTALLVTCSGATFNTSDLLGVPGTPLHRRGTTSLTVVDENRVYSAAATTLTTYYLAASSGGSSETAAVGVIAGLAVLPKFGLPKTGENFDVKEVEMHLDTSYSGALAIWTAANEESFALKASQTMGTKNHTYAPGDGGCWVWSVKFTQTDATQGFGIRALAIHYREFPGRRLP